MLLLRLLVFLFLFLSLVESADILVGQQVGIRLGRLPLFTVFMQRLRLFTPFVHFDNLSCPFRRYGLKVSGNVFVGGVCDESGEDISFEEIVIAVGSL